LDGVVWSYGAIPHGTHTAGGSFAVAPVDTFDVLIGGFEAAILEEGVGFGNEIFHGELIC
jgi:hypothetical protein